MPRTFAYVRVSTMGQTTENQIQEIEAAGFQVEPRRIVTETVSGSTAIVQRRGFSRLMDKLEAHVSAEPPPIRLERLEVTAELEAVLAKMMAKRPEDRYQTAAEVAAALLPFARADAAKEPEAETVEEVPPPPTPAPRPKPVVAEAEPEPESRTAAEPVRRMRSSSSGVLTIASSRSSVPPDSA